ncbi:MAG: hypothetical protein GWP19_15505 [Planctomycetia bacterium]|nr:hypothetical protein [Planctomycetia bacterium]
MKKLLVLTVVLLMITINLFAQNKNDGSNGKFSGYMFGDYYYVSDQNNPELKNQNGFWFRRVYFTYDYTIDGSFSTRLRLEISNDGKYESSDKMVPFVKDAYLQYKFGKQKALLGISSTPSWNVVEKIWGYRSVEKSPLDLQKMASSRDFGLAAKGQFDKKGKFKYHAMFANGSSNKQEINKGKLLLVSLSYWPTKEIVFEIYGDYGDKGSTSDTYVGQAFLGYKSKKLHGGILYAAQTIQAQNDDEDNINLNIFSAFLSGYVAESIKLIGRVDRMFEPNPKGNKVAYIPFDKTTSFTFFLAGIDFQLAKTVSIMPNIKYVKYDENKEGVSPTNDLYANVTFYWKFK